MHKSHFVLCLLLILMASGCSSDRPTLYAASSGTYDLSTEKVPNNVELSAEKTMGYVTFIGSNQESQVLTGGFGGATLQPGTKDTILNAGVGPAIYEFGPVFGHDVINNLPPDQHITRPHGEIVFNSLTITENRLWFQRSNKDLVITMLGTPQTIQITNWYGDYEGAQVVAIKLTKGLKLDLDIEDLVSVMTKYMVDNPSFDPQKTDHMPSDPALQEMITTTWHH